MSDIHAQDNPHRRLKIQPGPRIAALVIAALLGLLGAGLAYTGTQIALLGGTWFFVITGLLLLAGALLQFMGRYAAGGVVFAAAALFTIGWSFFEIAGKGFLPAWGIDLAGRAGLITGFVALNIFFLLIGLAPQVRPRWARPLAAGGLVAGLAVVAGLVAFHWERPADPSGGTETASADNSIAPGHNAADEWTAYGGSPLGAGYSPADEITPQNVSDLDEVWRFRTRDLPPNESVAFAAQNTPLYVKDRIFACSPSNEVFAIDPADGTLIWGFSPEVPDKAMEPLFSVACRAVGYHPGQATAAPTDTDALAVGAQGDDCGARIYVTTTDGRLISLSAETGSPCESFGEGGTVDLTENMGLQTSGFASSSSGPAVIGDTLIIGQQVSDNQQRDAPSGVVRAYDAFTGELQWAWDSERQGMATDPLPEGEIYPRGTPNVWNVISGDPDAGLVYFGTGNSANDHYGGDRSEHEDRFTAAIVAVDLESGETVWDFATMSHDLWDYDLGAQPALLDLEIEGETRRVLLQATKQGSLYLFDAATGEPMRPIEDRPAPQGDGPLPGDRLSPTQPQSVYYPNLSGLPGDNPEELDARHAWGVGLIDTAMCRRDFLKMDYEGTFTPPSDNPDGTLLFPGTIGGMNWGGVGIDLERQIVVTNNSRLPNRLTMYPREEVEDLPIGEGGSHSEQDIVPHWKSPWGITRPIWLSALGMPCIAPPWGILAATDLVSGNLVWSQPIGTGFDSGPMGMSTYLKLPMGTATIGGPLVTGTGLTFIASAQDNFLRAFETETGRLLWEGRLPAGGQASPMTYEHEGRQYVVISAAGHERLQTDVGDYVVAYALPE
ncbi:pyrroloquinoline quinone-dependent dehydrogenase [Amaricoccus macauensis]|uniref:pyrroloquinoline quinone-dependent dehydrogenase n=1 Tax=Amaricoccus macauensis TaxID=57001 RepID=UPI003C7AF748